MKKIFTFWEGEMPDYIKLCMKTWKLPYIILNYKNIKDYNLEIPDKIKLLTLPKIADYVRVHILRDNGGYWLDCDTIMLSNNLPSEVLLGDHIKRSNTIGFLNAEPHSKFFEAWAKYQDYTVQNLPNLYEGDTTSWNIMGNLFTDQYLKENKEIKIGSIIEKWPETYMIKLNESRRTKYINFYFKENFKKEDIKNTNILMLHNSWTPDFYKKLNEEQILSYNCTLSNILKETI